MDCLKCKDPKSCLGKDWFSYFDFERYCVHQVIWLITNAEILEDGRWPPNEEESNYIDPGIITGYRNEAYFIKPEVIIGELNKRIKRTGIEGTLLRSEIKASETLDSMEPEARTALFYVVGWRRKKQSYAVWKADTKDRRKPTKL